MYKEFTNEKSSDLTFTLSSSHLSLKQHSTSFPSRHIINTFLLCQKSFTSDWTSTAHKDEALAIFNEKFCATDVWSWFDCAQHKEEVTNKLGQIFASSLIVKKCHLVNTEFEELRLKRARQAEKQTSNEKNRILSPEDFAVLYNSTESAQQLPTGEIFAPYL